MKEPRSVSVFTISLSPHSLQTVGRDAFGEPQNAAASMVRSSPEALNLRHSSAENIEETNSKKSAK